MEFLDITLPSAAENVALDEALLLDSESAQHDGDVLRVWEPTAPMVVLGRSSVTEQEIDLAACRDDGVSVIRRNSGGCAILAAPGCLMYALVLSYARRPHLRPIHAAHRYVLDTLAMSLGRHATGLAREGTSDLALGGRKVSGNSLRCQRTHLLYHGTLLYDMPLVLMSRYLRRPPREPDYRGGRGHADFLAQLPASREQLVLALRDAFEASEALTAWPADQVQRLVTRRYGSQAWNLRGVSE